MPSNPTPTKTARKLSRAQVMEILERNCRLYRDENTFVPYLVELAMYLLEYEYNWEESGTQPPKFTHASQPAKGRSTESRPISMTQIPLKGSAITPKPSRHCPHCGSGIGEELVCPVCRNLSR